MSDDSEFDRLLKSARGRPTRRAVPPAAARRLEAALESRVQWPRRLPPKIAAGLAAMTDARASAAGVDDLPASQPPPLAARWSWTKTFAVLLPALGVVAVSYSVQSASSVGHAVPSAALPPVAPTSAPTEENPVLNAADPDGVEQGLSTPNDLPDAPERPTIPPPQEQPPKAALARANHTDDGRFEVELALLTQVTAALREKRPSRALDLINEHDRRFPDGTLTPEFAGERVLALAALGRNVEACNHSTTFLAKYPTSPIAPEVRSACVDSTRNR